MLTLRPGHPLQGHGGVGMSELSTKDRKALPRGDFAIPSKAPGSGSYPIEDRSHAMNALSRVSANGSPAEKSQVRHAVAKKFPGLATPKPSVAAHGVPRMTGHGERQLDGSRTPTFNQPAPKRSGMAPREAAPARSSGGSGMEASMGALADKLHPQRGKR